MKVLCIFFRRRIADGSRTTSKFKRDGIRFLLPYMKPAKRNPVKSFPLRDFSGMARIPPMRARYSAADRNVSRQRIPESCMENGSHTKANRTTIQTENPGTTERNPEAAKQIARIPQERQVRAEIPQTIPQGPADLKRIGKSGLPGNNPAGSEYSFRAIRRSGYSR